MSDTPFRILHFEFPDDREDDTEQGYVLFPLDTRGADAGDALDVPPFIPSAPHHMARYGFGPGIVIHVGSRTGVTFSLHTCSPDQDGHGRLALRQLQYGMNVAAVMMAILEEDPGIAPAAMMLAIARETRMVLEPGARELRSGEPDIPRPPLDWTPEDNDDT